MNSESKLPIELSIVATIYNSSESIIELVNQLKLVISKLDVSYEIILVDDCSSDQSRFIMESLSKIDLKIKSIFLSRNFGQQISMSAGIHHATGKYIVIMDGDLQNPSESIYDLYHKIREGYDIVYTTSASKNNFWDSLTSFLFWKFIKVFIRSEIIERQLMMRIFSDRIASFYKMYPEKIRTIASITLDIGMRPFVIPVKNKKRKFGSSNYSFFKRINLGIDVFLDLSNQPLNFLFHFGFVTLIISMFSCFYYLYKFIFFDTFPGYTSIVLVLMFFGSVNLIAIGIVSRYVGNIYTEVKCRPLYFIEKTINIDLI
jgi:glycosyltransferase involved in cell wall biosynthesis